MKINSLSAGPTTATAGRSAGRPAAATTADGADTSVKLSGASAALAAGGSAPVDSARVQEIRAAISEGRFQINTGAIADRLIETARALVQHQASERS